MPQLDPADLQEKITPGSGPGVQAVNKTANAVFLKHLPTGLWVKCHQTRSVEMNRKMNRKIAKQLLVTKLDNLVNGENSVENQKKVIAKVKFDRKKEKTRKKYEERKLESAMKNREDQGEDPT